MKTLYLYGPPASGKSTLARELSRTCGRMSVDLDEEIVRRAGRSIPEIFATDGEEGFRRLESEALRAVTAPIVALGGGTLLNAENRAYAEEHGMVVVLDVDAATIADRIAKAKGARPLGDRLRERAAHYASFAHHVDADTRILLPRKIRGRITPPVSKSHLHRLLIAEFLADPKAFAMAVPTDSCADIDATYRCLVALSRASNGTGGRSVTLDVGESGSTLRFLAPIVAALGLTPEWIRHGRLASRPMIEYRSLESGVHELAGNVSSQFVTGLLFALPLIDGNSSIRFTSPLESRGYVDLTLDVIRRYGIRVDEVADGFEIPGGQRFVSPGAVSPEADWSGAAFWFAANALGSEIEIAGLNPGSRQPDACVESRIAEIVAAAKTVAEPRVSMDVSSCPDLYPALAVVNAYYGSPVAFTGTERLRIKESDRLAAMAAVLADPTDVDAQNDHRIAMAAAVYSTVQDGPVLIHGASSVAKSYPGFWNELQLDLYAVCGWPLVKTRSPEIHNAAHTAAGRKAEMISYPAETIEEALAFAERCGVKGMAVTIPHKESVMRHLDEIDPAARAIGAVNTVDFRGGRRIGYNTDADGFAEAVTAFVGRDSFVGMKVVLLGCGGAAKAVRFALERLGAEVEVWHRETRATHPDLFVNATPVDPIPDYRFNGRELVYDLVYVPEETPLMVHARAAGCKVENGYSMLLAQARRQLAIWTAQA